MKTYNYYRSGVAITKTQFTSVVPANWENDVIEGTYSWGCYRAEEIA